MIPLVWTEKSRFLKAAAIIYPSAGSQRSKTSARLSNALNRLGQGDANLLREEAQIQRFLDEVVFELFISRGQIAIGEAGHQEDAGIGMNLEHFCGNFQVTPAGENKIRED